MTSISLDNSNQNLNIKQCNIEIHQSNLLHFTSKYTGNHSFITKIYIHSFIINSGHFYNASLSPLLLRSTPDYSTDTVSEFRAKAHRQMQVEDLPKVPVTISPTIAN